MAKPLQIDCCIRKPEASSIRQPRCPRFPLRPVALRPLLSQGLPLSNLPESLHSKNRAVNLPKILSRRVVRPGRRGRSNCLFVMAFCHIPTSGREFACYERR